MPEPLKTSVIRTEAGGVKKKSGLGAFGVFALVFSSTWSRRGRLTSAVFGDSFDVWLGAAAAPTQSFSRRLSR